MFYEREREAPLSWSTPRMLRQYVGVSDAKLEKHFHLTKRFRFYIFKLYMFCNLFLYVGFLFERFASHSCDYESSVGVQNGGEVDRSSLIA